MKGREFPKTEKKENEGMHLSYPLSILLTFKSSFFPTVCDLLCLGSSSRYQCSSLEPQRKRI